MIKGLTIDLYINSLLSIESLEFLLKKGNRLQTAIFPLVVKLFTCLVKVNLESRMTPRYVISELQGICVLETDTVDVNKGRLLVNKIHFDLDSLSLIFHFEKYSFIFLAECERRLAIVSVLQEEESIAASSAYRHILVCSVVGMSFM